MHRVERGLCAGAAGFACTSRALEAFFCMSVVARSAAAHVGAREGEEDEQPGPNAFAHQLKRQTQELPRRSDNSIDAHIDLALLRGGNQPIQTDDRSVQNVLAVADRIERALLDAGLKPPEDGADDEEEEDEEDEEDEEEDEDEEDDEAVKKPTYPKKWHEVYRDEFEKMDFAAYTNMPERFRANLNKNVTMRLIEMYKRLTLKNSKNCLMRIEDFLDQVAGDQSAGASKPSRGVPHAAVQPLDADAGYESSEWKTLDGGRRSNTKLPRELTPFLWQAFGIIEQPSLEAITNETTWSDWKTITKQKLRGANGYYDSVLKKARELVAANPTLDQGQKINILKWCDNKTTNFKSGLTELHARVNNGWEQARLYNNVGKQFPNVRTIINEKKEKDFQRSLEKKSKEQAAALVLDPADVAGLEEN
jgi:hypothetical protein